MPELTTIGERIFYARKLQELSQEGVGRLLGITRSALSQYEKGKIRHPKPHRIAQLAALFGCDPGWITSGEGKPPPPPPPRPAALTEAHVLYDPKFVAIVHPDPATNQAMFAWVLRQQRLQEIAR